MPYVKSISVRTTVNKSLAYILNPDKTENLLYTTSLNCLTNAKDAYLSMKTVFEHFSGKNFNAPLPAEGKGSVKAIHYIQSFDPQDNVSPELAHRIAKAFARKTFGDDCQVVIATHLDKQHVHNHLIINTYSLTGQKFNDNWTTRQKVREYSDRVCLAFGIQPIITKKGQGRSLAYNEWENKKRGTSWKEKIRLEIDRLIDTVKNLDELLYELDMLGYTIKKGKYISIKAPEQERFVRTKTLGEDYTEESLISRIRWRDVGASVTLSGEPAPIRDDYIRTLNDVTELAKTGRKIQRKRFRSEPYSPENDLDVYKISAQLSVINRDNIHSIGELEGKIQRLKSEYENARRELNALIVKQEKLEGLTEQAETYFSLADKSELSDTEQLSLKICRQTLLNNNISDRYDFERLKTIRRETDKKIAVLKNTFENCEGMYEVYRDIADTYYSIAKGDYISKLVEEERKINKRRETKLL
ncbi:MAG: relaxase/mobilization nuclease domain-containing protein [Eubacterium sp.]|nr:relaxase/mobilization nuclease domain-containing protein [Eubacterium sp.]